MSVSSSDAKARGRTQDLYRWRGQKTLRGRFGGGFYHYCVKLFWATLLVAALLLFSWLIWLLLFAPQRTPLIVLASEPYAWPLPPNALAAEDIDKLAALDGQSITLRSGDEQVRSKQGFLDRLQREVQLSERLNKKLPLVIWVSMHGVADHSTGKAYLIPVQSSSTDSKTWIDLDELLTRLDSLPPDRNALLILDCQRMQVNWNIGLLENPFTEVASEIVRTRAPRNLAVLLAADTGQRSVVSQDLRGSVFGHFFRQGLAGAADIDSEFGNNDGWVSITELRDYLQQRVNRWTTRNRSTQQTPVLLSREESLDFAMARALRYEAINTVVTGDQKIQRSAPNISADQLDRLWRQRDELRDLGLYQSEPTAWRDLEHTLLWLEQLSESGTGYYSTALRKLEDAERQLQGIEQRVARLRQTRSVGDACTLVSGQTWQLPERSQMHSLGLVEYFGSPKSPSMLALGDLLERFAAQPDPSLLNEALSKLAKGSGTAMEGEQFLRMLNRYQFSGLWRQTQLVSQVLSVRANIQNLIVPRDDQGLPADARIHGWTRQLVSLADVSRRSAEDSLFIGGQNGLAEHLDQTQASIQDAVVATRTLQQILQTCDRSMAETPYIAQWLTHPLRRDGAETMGQDIEERLLPLISNTSELSKLLVDDQTVSIDSIIAVEDFAATDVRPHVDALQEHWNRSLSDLIGESESNDASLLGEIEAALSVPLAQWDTRRDLRNARVSLETRLHVEDDEVGEAQNDDEDRDESSASKTDLTDSELSSERLFLAILGAESESASVDQNPIGSFLERIANKLAKQSEETTLVDQRAICGEAAREYRIAAPVWFASPRRDPIIELRQIDLQSILLWNAKRSLDDFWGPAGSEVAFFDRAASDYLHAASEMADLRSSGAVASEDLLEVRELTARLDASRRAASSWLTTESGSTIQIDAEDPVETVISVRADSEHVAFEPPSGTAALFLQDGLNRRLEGTSFDPGASVDLPAADAQVALTLRPDLARSHSDLKVQVMFRGHEYGGALDVEQLGGIVVDLSPYRYRSSEVTLSGPWNHLSVVFILDCSRSMDDPLGAAGEDGNVKNRMDVAKSAMQEILFNLGMRRNVRAGVLFIGHRLGWSTDPPVRPLVRPDFTGAINPEVTPSQDVESVLPLQPLDLTAAKTVIPRISDVKPWGQSPLYFSVVQALGDFGPEDADADRHVIVITDGANYQYIPAMEANVQPTTGDHVRGAWEQQPVPVHILGLGMDRAQDQQAIEEFTQLCLDTGGDFQSLTGSTDLTSALARILDPGTYRLGEQAEATLSDRRAVLGKPIRVAPAPQIPQQFWLTFEGRASSETQGEAIDPYRLPQEIVQFEGGESLQLYVNQTGTSIGAWPFDENVAAESALVTQSGQATDHLVRIHRPDRDAQGHVTIPVSWQRQDNRGEFHPPSFRVTDRPSEVWIEVQPMSSDEQPRGQAYVFCDLNCEPDQPVPLINLVAQDWPAEASRARVRLWCQPPTSADLVLFAPDTSDGDQVASHSGSPHKFVVNDSLQSPTNVAPGVTLRVDQPTPTSDGQFQRLRMVLQFQEDKLSVTDFKVCLPAYSSVKPARIVRKYDPQHHLAVHEYYFDQQYPELPTEIEVWNRQHQLEGAWQLADESLLVDILEPGMFLQVDPAN